MAAKPEFAQLAYLLKNLVIKIFYDTCNGVDLLQLGVWIACMLW